MVENKVKGNATLKRNYMGEWQKHWRFAGFMPLIQFGKASAAQTFSKPLYRETYSFGTCC